MSLTFSGTTRCALASTRPPQSRCDDDTAPAAAVPASAPPLIRRQISQRLFHLSLFYLCICWFEKRIREQPSHRRCMATRSGPAVRLHSLSPAKLPAHRPRNWGLSFLYSSLSLVSSPISSDSLSPRLPTATRSIVSLFHWVSRPVDSFPSLLYFSSSLSAVLSSLLKPVI